MTMKTPKQIADATTAKFYEFGDPEDGIRSGYLETGVIKRMITAAIEADRRQRGLIECIAEALDDRGAEDAARLVRDTDPDDDLWNNYVGPMLDSIEDDYTRMAREDQG